MIIKYDNKAIKYTNKWISVDSQPTPPGPTPVEYVQIGNLLWKTANTDISVESGMQDFNISYGGKSYGTQRYYNAYAIAYLFPLLLTDGWRIPAYQDWMDLFTAVNMDPSKLCASSPDWSGTNETGFTALPFGEWISNQTAQPTDIGSLAYFYENMGRIVTINPSTIGMDYAPDLNNYYCSVRLCKSVT